MPTLLLAKTRQTCSRSEFPSFAQLVPRGSDRLTEVFFGLPFMRPGQQRKFAFEAEQFGLLAELVAPLGNAQTLIERVPGIVKSAGLNVSVAEDAEVVGKPDPHRWPGKLQGPV